MVVVVCNRLVSHSILEHIVHSVHSCVLCALCALTDTILSIVHRSACFILMCTSVHFVHFEASLCTLCTSRHRIDKSAQKCQYMLSTPEISLIMFPSMHNSFDSKNIAIIICLLYFVYNSIKDLE